MKKNKSLSKKKNKFPLDKLLPQIKRLYFEVNKKKKLPKKFINLPKAKRPLFFEKPTNFVSSLIGRRIFGAYFWSNKKNRKLMRLRRKLYNSYGFF